MNLASETLLVSLLTHLLTYLLTISISVSNTEAIFTYLCFLENRR
jgi:hypothetical protein